MRGVSPRRVSGSKRSYTRDFPGKDRGFPRYVLGNSQTLDRGSKGRGQDAGSEHQRRLSKSQGRKKGKGARLREADTRVQRRSSLGKYVASRGFIYQRLGKFWNNDQAKGTQWNAMESRRSTYE